MSWLVLESYDEDDNGCDGEDDEDGTGGEKKIVGIVRDCSADVLTEDSKEKCGRLDADFDHEHKHDDHDDHSNNDRDHSHSDNDSMLSLEDDGGLNHEHIAATRARAMAALVRTMDMYGHMSDDKDNISNIPMGKLSLCMGEPFRI